MPPDQTLITAAVFAEVKPLVRRLGLRRVRPARPEPTWSSGTTTLLLTGMGLRAGPCVRAAIESVRPERVLSVGVAGALSPGLAVGQVVVPQRVTGPDRQEHTPTIPAATSGSLVTVDRVVATPDEKRRLAESSGADVVDMETAHIAAACEAVGVPWLSVRAVSDAADHAIPAELGAMTTDAGQPDIPAVIAWSLGRPRRMAALVALGRRTRLAADRLAGGVVELL